MYGICAGLLCWAVAVLLGFAVLLLLLLCCDCAAELCWCRYSCCVTGLCLIRAVGCWPTCSQSVGTRTCLV